MFLLKQILVTDVLSYSPQFCHKVQLLAMSEKILSSDYGNKKEVPQ